MAVLFLYCSFRLPQTYTLLTSFGSKKEEPKCYCPSKSPENEPPTESLTGPLWRLYNLSRAFIYTYNHSPTYDHPTHKNPNLRSIFPKENFDSRPTEFATETPLRKFQFKLLRKRYLYLISNWIAIFLWRSYVTFILQHQYYWTEAPSTCWRVYISPN